MSAVAIPTAGATMPESVQQEFAGSDPDLWLYRERTVGLLKRYQRLSVEVGRLPSLLGREFFRTKVTAYHVYTFEDAVIFVHDVERALAKLEEFEQQLIEKMVFQEYTQREAAKLLGCWRRTVGRRFPETLDRLSEIFLRAGLLTRVPEANPMRPETCQEGKTEEILLSDSEETKYIFAEHVPFSPSNVLY